MQAIAKPAWPVLQRGHPMTRGMVAAYPLSEGVGGAVHDLSGNRFDLSASGAAAWAGSAFGTAPSFGGSVNFQTASAVNGLPTGATAAWAFGGWIVPSAYVNLTGVFGFGTGPFPNNSPVGTSRILLEFNSHYYFWGSSADWDTGIAFDSDGLPHHVVFTTAGGSTTPTIEFYRDGKLAASGSPGASLGTAGSYIVIAAGHPSQASNYKGSVASFFIANRHWSADDVRQDYADGFAIYRPRSRWWEVLVAGGATSYSFPTASWHWSGQAPTLPFASTSTARQWVWRPSAPSLGFQTAAAQKAWRWNGQMPALALAVTTAQKSWAWAANAPALSSAIAAVRQLWSWAANATISGGNLVTSVWHYMIGPSWRRRRSRKF